MTNNQIQYQRNLEQQRSNRKSEQLTEARDRAHILLTSRQLAEGERSNLARELETNRHNLATEQLQQYSTQMGISQRDREITLGESRLAADIEHNSEARAETHRSNKAREGETSRANRAKESQLAQDLNQRYAAMVGRSADEALPGLGLVTGLITSFDHMASPSRIPVKVDRSKVISGRGKVG